MDDYIKHYALPHSEANIARSYVALDGTTVRGFYSLTMSGVEPDNLPDQYRLRFPDFPLRVARVACLAVDLKHQRKGLGELLLADALLRCRQVGTSVGMLGVLLDATDEMARGWYQRYEFMRLHDAPLTLWLPAKALGKL